MRNKILSTLLMFGLMGQLFCSTMKSNNSNQNRNTSVKNLLNIFEEIKTGRKDSEYYLDTDKGVIRFETKDLDLEIVNAKIIDGRPEWDSAWKKAINRTADAKQTKFHSSFDGSDNQPNSCSSFIAKSGNTYYMIYISPNRKTSIFKLNENDLKKIVSNENLECTDGNGTYKFILNSKTNVNVSEYNYLVTPLEKYGFIGSSYVQISVGMSGFEGNDDFYFNQSSPGRLCAKIKGNEYDILNLKLSSDQKNFELEEFYGIKRLIYSSTASGMPPSLIAKKDGNYWLFYVKEGRGVGENIFKFNEKYEFSLIQLTEEDLNKLSRVSKRPFASDTLSNKYTVSRSWFQSYLILTPPSSTTK